MLISPKAGHDNSLRITKNNASDVVLRVTKINRLYDVDDT